MRLSSFPETRPAFPRRRTRVPRAQRLTGAILAVCLLVGAAAVLVPMAWHAWAVERGVAVGER